MQPIACYLDFVTCTYIPGTCQGFFFDMLYLQFLIDKDIKDSVMPIGYVFT